MIINNAIVLVNFKFIKIVKITTNNKGEELKNNLSNFYISIFHII